MNRVIKTAIISLIIAAPLFSAAQINEQPYILQSSTCEKKITPDELYISISISEKDNKGKKSVEELQNSMIATLKSLNIDIEKTLTLNFMGSEISYTTFRRNINPRTAATYTLKLNSADEMQKVISKLEAQEITNIRLVETKYSKADDIYKELATEAMKKAKEEATTLAAAIGQSIGPALSITSNKFSSENVQPRLYKARNNMGTEGASLATEEQHIEIGKITFNVSVNVRFSLKEE